MPEAQASLSWRYWIVRRPGCRLPAYAGRRFSSFSKVLSGVTGFLNFLLLATASLNLARHTPAAAPVEFFSLQYQFGQLSRNKSQVH